MASITKCSILELVEEIVSKKSKSQVHLQPLGGVLRLIQFLDTST